MTKILLSIALLFALTACSAAPTIAPTPTNAALPTSTTAPTVTAPPPTLTQPPPTSTSTPYPATPAATPEFPLHNPYAVILVPQNDILNVRQAAGADSPIVDRFAFDAHNLILTGKEMVFADQRWVEVQGPAGGGLGWVNAYYLTEYLTPNAFCADQQVRTLLENLDAAMTEQDGSRLSSLLSPTHGLNLQYFHTGNTANYNQEEAKWMFSSTYQMNWGMHPASGIEVKGSFHAEVLPKLMEVLESNYTLGCSDPTLGPNSYLFQWPKEYSNINFYSLFKPGTPGIDLDWRTWLVGVEYVNGEPTLFAMMHLFWEP